MAVRTLAFMVLREVLSLLGLDPSPDAKDVEIVYYATNYWSCPARCALAENVIRPGRSRRANQ